MKTCVIDIESRSLDPTSGRIICIGTLDADTGKTEVFHDEDEKKMLEDFLDYYAKNGFKRVVGFNLMFDVRYIFGRCLKYGVPVNNLIYSEIDDVMMTVKSAGRKIYNFNKPYPLENWSKLVLGEGKMFKSEDVLTLYNQGKIREIIDYNRQDLILTFKLWKRIRKVLGWNI